MKLTPLCKKKLLANADKVYEAYVAMDFFKTRFVHHEHDSNQSLEQLCKEAIEKKQYKKTFTLNGQLYALELTPDVKHSFKVSIQCPVKNLDIKRKKLTEYKDMEALDLISKQNFFLDYDKENQLHLTNKLNDTLELGGAGKIDLYRSHLVTLYRIIEKIEHEEDLSNLLVAQATGSGKTYVQALWMLVLSMSETNGVFGVPDKLVNQFHKDLKRLLPDSFVDDLLVLRENQDCSGVVKELANLKNKDSSPKLFLGSSERLLDEHYQELLYASSENTLLSFDEQHLLMKTERRRVRFLELAKQKLCMTLTATPNQETYKLSGNRPVAIMSSGQKEEAGQGKFPVLFSENAKTMNDRNAFTDYKFWKRDFWVTVWRGLKLRVIDLFEKDRSSSGVSIVENLPFYLHRKPDEKDVRWSMQVPAARKILCIIDDNETLINFVRAFNVKEEKNESSIYADGNIKNRKDVGPEVEKYILVDEKKKKQKAYLESLLPQEQETGNALVKKTLKTQVQDTIFHRMMEYVLSDLTGLDEIEQNRLRKENPQVFCALIRSKLIKRDAPYYANKLEKLIDKQGAGEISLILESLSEQLNQMSTQVSADDFALFADNWNLDDKIIAKLKSSSSALERNFSAYTKKYSILSVMKGMSHDETPVDESRPFSGLTEDRYQVYNKDGTLNPKAKKSSYGSLEAMAGALLESRFTPNYLDFSEEVCDNYFRLFGGVYISNKKTEGFSDRNLHTVINLSENQASSTNSPETLIQGIGRNRGLDETIVPAYIHALGRKQSSLFDLNHLKKDDYYPDLFHSQKKYNKQMIKALGTSIGKEIVQWFHANVRADETIDDKKLKRQVLKIIAKTLRTLNNNNNHDIRLSRAQLRQITSTAMSTLNDEIKRIKKPWSIPFTMGLVVSIFNFIGEMYYIGKRFRTVWKLSAYSRSSDKSKEDSTYIKIIKNTSYKFLVSKMVVISELATWLSRKQAGLEIPIQNLVEKYQKLTETEELSKQFKKEISDLIVTGYEPVLFHPSFYKCLNQTIGFLNKDELTVILKALKIETPESQADLIIQFMQILKHQDKVKLKKLFFTFPDNNKALTLHEKLPIQTTMELTYKVLGEFLDCHSYYNSHDQRGTQDSVCEPKLLEFISASLKNIQVPAEQSEISKMSRQIFFVQGLRKGLVESAQVNADSNASQVKIIKRINNHILRPLWWSSNASYLGYGIIKTGRNIAFAARATGFAVVNGFKKVGNFLSANSFTISEQNPHSTDYNDTSFEFTKQLNQLTPFDKHTVSKTDCPEDVVHHASLFIDNKEKVETEVNDKSFEKK